MNLFYRIIDLFSFKGIFMHATIHSFHAPLVLATENSTGEDIRIPVLRKTIFKAGRYGELVFSDVYLDSLVINFNRNVTGHDIAMDFNHKPEEGAGAWIRRVIREGEHGENLVLYASSTPFGREQLATQRYRYASAEINTDYEDRETGERFGPTLLGAAFTNRPYIHRQEPVKLFSNDEHAHVISIRTYESDRLIRGLLQFAAVTRSPQYITFKPLKEES